jgi:hypothetical protein
LRRIALSVERAVGALDGSSTYTCKVGRAPWTSPCSLRGIPLSDWIEHEILLEEGADVDRMVQDMTIFDKGVVSIADVPRRKALA